MTVGLFKEYGDVAIMFFYLIYVDICILHLLQSRYQYQSTVHNRTTQK